ncbi:MAG: NYN domain-containing protein [Candidatus Schekmanbacteria bacterium]|nr:NYN domain-containing protein [Candidatus Schekmanbacteria bacterium]
MEIIIDGYNLLMVLFGQSLGSNWEQARLRLLKQLDGYRAYRQHEITVVFDGWKSGWMMESSELYGNIKIIYSRQGEKADEVIKRLAYRRNGSPLVITSDREIIRAVEQAGAHTLSSAEFAGKLQTVSYPMGNDKDRYDDDDDDRPIGARKKGNPRRLPKKERQRRQRLDKL